MKKIIFGLGCLCLVSAERGLANGGGYERGGVETSGSIQGFVPQQTHKVQILDEQLTITLRPTAADVEVRYLMRNVSDSKATVRFGFPVEVSADRSDFDWDSERRRHARDEAQMVKGFCRDYQVTAFGKPLKAEWQAETRQREDPRMQGIAGWMVSDFKLDPGTEMPLHIRYTCRLPYSFFSVSENASESYGNFKYRLSTAACWAGPLAKGRIVIKPDGVRLNEVKVIKPVNRFKKFEGSWVWEFEKLEPTLADDIEVEPRPAESSYPGSVTLAGDKQLAGRCIERGERWFIEHAAYGITASSTLPPADGHRYDAANLKAGDGSFWSEGAKGRGVGEWLEITPEVAKPLDAIAIRPGCWLSPELFAANARPRKIKVELNGERSLEVEIPDQMADLEIPVLDYAKPVTKLKLTILEVWPGSRHEDLCLSSIRLKACLDQKPNITPSR